MWPHSHIKDRAKAMLPPPLKSGGGLGVHTRLPKDRLLIKASLKFQQSGSGPKPSHKGNSLRAAQGKGEVIIRVEAGVPFSTPHSPLPPQPGPAPARSTLPVWGRLQLFWRVWQQQGVDPYAARLMKESYKISFHTPPPLSRVPTVST